MKTEDRRFDDLLNSNGGYPGLVCSCCGDSATYPGEPCACHDDPKAEEMSDGN